MVHDAGRGGEMHKMGEKRKRFRINLGALAAALGIGAVGSVPVQAVTASSAVAPLIRVDLTQDRNDFAAIAAWATRYGHKMTMRGDVAKLAGVSRGKEVDVTGVSYQNKSGLRIFFAVLPGRPEIVMARVDSAYSLWWFVTDGTPASLIYLDEHELTKLTNSTKPTADYYDEAFRLLIGVFLTKMKACSADATACPAGR
jgi:hypothetical protein